jgi:hypothetical protein
MTVNSYDHHGPANDNLLDGVAQNMAYYLAQVGTPGQFAGAVRASRVAATSGINTTETLLVNAALVIPNTYVGNSIAGTLNAGSVVRATIVGTCTSSNADVSTFTLRMGTAGTVAGDTSVATWTVTSSGSGSSVVFRAVLDLTIRTLQTTSSANGTGYGSLAVQNTGATGIVGVTNTVVASASAISALPTNTATYLDISYVSAATTTTTTFQEAILEIIP